jgi:hypothetical protein
MGTYSRMGVGVGLIDASRRVGTYYDWETNNPNYNPEIHSSQNPGFGIHIANHSYNMRVFPFNRPNETGLGDSIFIDDIDNPVTNECQLCREAFLFSLKNGVTNVVSRGNRTNMLISEIGLPKVPTIYDDSWIISVGSSDINGNFIDANELIANGYVSYIGRSVDVIAPGTKSTVYTTKSTHVYSGLPYRNFNGSSAAAPHVSGVASLLLSKYNKPCYSNINLDPADVEYIIQKSATDLGSVNYDDSTGWGLLNAEKALQMIEYPRFQIVHPENTLINIELIKKDTIHFFVNNPLYADFNGPIGQSFIPALKNNYKAVRYAYELTYDFSNYILPSTQLIDAWVRFSQTNSVILTTDTSYYLGYVGNTGQVAQMIDVDTFGVEPYAYITMLDSVNNKIKLKGYYYNFTNKLNDEFNNEIDTINFWYPLNPLINEPSMAFSIYIFDSTLIDRYDFPCDSSNLLLDTNVSLNEININDINIYPNPSDGILNIESFSNILNGKLKLTNLEGRTVYNVEVKNKKEYKLNFDNLPSGVYFIEFQSEKKNIAKKWIKL